MSAFQHCRSLCPRLRDRPQPEAAMPEILCPHGSGDVQAVLCDCHCPPSQGHLQPDLLGCPRSREQGPNPARPGSLSPVPTAPGLELSPQRQAVPAGPRGRRRPFPRQPGSPMLFHAAPPNRCDPISGRLWDILHQLPESRTISLYGEWAGDG